MILEMYSVYDSAVQAYMTPFFVRSKGEAIRSFSEAVNDEKHQFSKHASDYSLFALGAYDDNSGSVEGLKVPVRVITALECLERRDRELEVPRMVMSGPAGPRAAM